MPEPALAAGGLSLVGKALASISPNLVVASSAAVQLFSWLQLARIPISAVVASVAILMLIPMHYNVLYGVLTSTNTKDIDDYTSKGISGFPNKKISWFDKIKVAFLHGASVGKHKRSLSTTPLTAKSSPFVKGLQVSSRQDKGDPPLATPDVVVGTIRMGFGHHRIAYSTSSWGIKKGEKVLFHDLLSVDSSEADLIIHADKMYSRGSRIASEMGGIFERMWGKLMKSGDENALRNTNLMAENLRPLLYGLPKDTPIIATHCLVGNAAVACGFKNVINLVIDNYPQWFVIVPGALNLVQGPVNYQHFLRMGVPENELKMVGHWCPADLVNNIEADTTARKARLAKGAPVRILIPVGGAGAQKSFVTKFLESLGSQIRNNEVQIILNAGDHKHMKESFLASIKKMGFKKNEFEIISSMEGVNAFADRLRSGSEPGKAITLFAFDDYFPAVAATDVLCRVTDVLACKPSELAFYPVPKLMLRRVGDHEASSATRAAELGDGTTEIRDVDDAVAWVRLFGGLGGGRSLLNSMNDRILANSKLGTYDGCKTAIEIAKQMKGGADTTIDSANEQQG